MIADAYVLALDLVLIVQRGVRHHHAADADRFQPRDRRQRAGAADLYVDGVDDSDGLLRREFMRDRPARRAGDEAEPFLPVEAVDLVDDAVDLIGKVRALLPHAFVVFENVGGAAADFRGLGFSKAPCEQFFADAVLRVGDVLFHFTECIAEEMQWALGRDFEIQLAQAARRGVARVGENLLSGRRLRLVHLHEVVAAHVDFAAHFK